MADQSTFYWNTYNDRTLPSKVEVCLRPGNNQLIRSEADTAPVEAQTSPPICDRQVQLEAYYDDVRRRAYGHMDRLQHEAEIAALQTEQAVREAKQAEWCEVDHSTAAVQTAVPKKRLGFLDLPGEIRNNIYLHALVLPTPINGIDTKIPTIGLLSTSKLIHKESSSMFYEHNTFTFGLQIDWARLPEIFLAGFPKLPIWPTPRYHGSLSKLHIKFQFRSGDPSDTIAPESLQKSMHAMRAAYDQYWDNLGKQILIMLIESRNVVIAITGEHRVNGRPLGSHEILCKILAM
jgi:hypothetical protein